MIKLAGDGVESSGAAVVGLLASGCRICECSLLVCGASTCNLSLQLLLARVSCWRGEPSACGEGLLRGLGAGKATGLAPAEQAISFAVCGAILARHGVALGASGRNAGGGSEARVELVMIKLASDDVESCGAAVVGLLASGCRICECSLLVGRTSTCNLSLQLLFA